MSFLNPYLLWGLLAVSIPVIIHLFNFRRFRRIYFTNVKFLEELQQQTRRQSQLRHILVMILRMLAITSLVLAFAQPYIPLEKAGARPEKVNHVSVYIDNSFSMESLSSGGPLLEVAKGKARELASSYQSSDLFALVTNDFEGKHQRWLSKDEFLQALDEIAISPNVRTVSEVIGRQRDMLYNTEKGRMFSYLISDFQEDMCDFQKVVPDSLVSTWLVPLNAAKKENLYIDSCWFASPVHQLNQGVKLMARVVNQSETDYEKVPLKLTVNGQQKAVASFDIPKGLYKDIELPFTSYEPGFQYGTLEITDYPITFDDRLFMVYNVAGRIPVLSINGQSESQYLDALYGNDSAFLFVNNPYTNIDYNRLPDFNLVILNELKDLSSGLSQELTNYLDNGGTVLIIPSPEMDMAAFQQFLSANGSNFYTELVKEDTRVSGVDTKNPVFSDVFERSKEDGTGEAENTDWPVVMSYYKLSRSTMTSQLAVMTLLNGMPFLTREMANNGKIFLLAVPLEDSYSNFASHAIFVPALYRIALLGAATDPLYYTIGKDDIIELYNSTLTGDKTLKIISMTDQSEFIPGQFSQNRRLDLRLNGQLKVAGHYQVKADQEVVKGLGFNYSRMESIMKFNDIQQLQEMVDRYLPGNSGILTDKGKPLSDAIKEMNQGTSLWKLFIILALVFLGSEIALLRFWNKG
jgi:hypothetical protein